MAAPFPTALLLVCGRLFALVRALRVLNGNLVALVEPSAQINQPTSFAAEGHRRALRGFEFATTDRTFNSSHRRWSTDRSCDRKDSHDTKNRDERRESPDSRLRENNQQVALSAPSIRRKRPARIVPSEPRLGIAIRLAPPHERQGFTHRGSVAVRLFYSLFGAAAHLLSALHAPLPHVLLPPADSEAAAFLYDSLR